MVPGRRGESLPDVAAEALCDIGRIPVGPIVVAMSKGLLVVAVRPLGLAEQRRQPLPQIVLSLHSASFERPIARVSLCGGPAGLATRERIRQWSRARPTAGCQS